MAYTQEQINAALAAELAARPNTSAYDLASYAMQTYGITPAQIDRAYQSLNVSALPETIDYETNYGGAPVGSFRAADSTGYTGPSQKVTDPNTGKQVELIWTAPGFNPTDPTTLRYLGEQNWRDPNSYGATWYNNFATPAQKATADALWSSEWKKLNAQDVANEIPGAVASGMMPKTGADALKIISAAQTAAATKTGLLSGQTVQSDIPSTAQTALTTQTGLLKAGGQNLSFSDERKTESDPGTTRQAMEKTMANPSAVPKGFIEGLTAIPNVTDQQIVNAMKTANVSPKNLADALGIAEGEVAARVARTVPYGSTVQLGDTIVQPVYQVTGSGQDQQIGAIENVLTYRASDNKPGGGYTQYTPDGTFQRSGTQMKVNATKDFVKFALTAGALFGGAALAGVGTAAQTAGLAGAELAAATQGLTGAQAATAGFTQQQLISAGFTNAEITSFLAAGGTVGGTAAVVAGATAAEAAAAKAAADAAAATAAGGLTASQLSTAARLGLTATQFAGLIASGGQTVAGLLQQETSREAAVKAQGMIDTETAAAKAAAGFRPVGMTTRFGTSEFKTDPVTGQLTSAGYTLSPEAKYAQDFFRTQANLGLQQVELAPAVYAPLKTGANMMFDLGQQALNQPTDARLGQIATDYLTQSAGSKALQTLGEKYIAQSPEEVAQNYLNQQMALLQPGRELELANLQNKLQQQGRGGLAVAQGGALGATTPELQALYNARATQEAQLAASAQQAGQQQVQFGAGLFGTGQQLGMQGQAFGVDTLAKQQALDQQRIAFGSNLYGTGAQTLGNYYTGLQQSYAPYNAAFGQMQALETAGQQPLTLAANLGQASSAAGARVGQLGLQGAGQSVALATGNAATTNPYATAIGGLFSNPAFATAAGTALGTLFL
jgi:hypothetical protein